MKNLQNLEITATAYTGHYSKNGTLENKYAPFKNLIKENGSIGEFRTNEMEIDLNSPINIEIQPSFDGSVNLILNDNLTTPKLINSRFSIEEGDTVKIIDHEGNKDTNIYSEDKLDLELKLYKAVNKIPTLVFNGLRIAGKMLCGNYHFYFKLSDNDGNETDFISESGLVTCHIGNINDPYSIRMGMANEDSKKSISFKLSNLDSAYDFVKVYYTRITSDSSQIDITTAHYIDINYPINKGIADIVITGFETQIDISLLDINPLYEIVSSAKTQAQCQNMLFLANIDKPKIPYTELKDLSLRFIPKLINGESVGNVASDYSDYSSGKSFEYYNAKNIYYNLGLWPEEYYRLGIVYLMSDFTLSPVFNTRGIEFKDNTSISNMTNILTGDSTLNTREYISFDEDGFINRATFENVNGVIKLGKLKVISSKSVNPIGIQFTLDADTLRELKLYTRGFFIVRQERIPTIYSQGIVIGKTKNDYGNLPILYKNGSYFTESFLKNRTKNVLETAEITEITEVENKAVIMPEAEIRSSLFSQLFTSAEFKITKPIEQVNDKEFKQGYPSKNYYVYRDIETLDNTILPSLVTLVKEGVKLTSNGIDYFSAKAGEAEQAWETSDVKLNWKTVDGSGTKVNEILTESESLVRGTFGTYVGLSSGGTPIGTIIDIRPSDFEYSDDYKLIMFKSRMDLSSPYFAVSDRIAWENFEKTNILEVFRGDCFVCNFTHRVNSNFIDSELPIAKDIVDINTWNKNYTVYQDYVNTTPTPDEAVNRQLLSYKQRGVETPIEPSDAHYETAGTGLNSLFATADYKIKGCDKINRADVNTVPLGHWVTFKVMSNINLSMRDIDFSNPVEESIHGYKRSFYPLKKLDTLAKLPESNVINGATNVTLSQRLNFIVPDVPFIKNKFDTRILYSDIHVTDAFKNGYRVFQSGNYRDYTKVYGSIIDIKDWYSNLFITLEHGCLLIPVNERAVAAEGAGGLAYINTSNVLPQTPKILSPLFGSIWQESIIKTNTGIYGFDTVAKKLWVSDGETFSIISDLKVQKFLNENIDLKESDKLPTLGVKNVKTHYNRAKGDIIFTFYNGEKEWSLCYNENLKKFITRYSWTPSYSSNLNNTFFSFNKKDTKTIKNGGSTSAVDFWKHGQSGIYSNQNKISPTKWYDTQEPFEFEFVVTEIPIAQKIFNNLNIISNKAEPHSFEFEVVGETYDWYEVKDLIVWINKNTAQLVVKSNTKFGISTGNLGLDDLQRAYKYILSLNLVDIESEYPEFIRPFSKEGSQYDGYKFPKLPFLNRTRKSTGLWEANSANVTLVPDDLLNEDRINTQQTGNSIKKYGRVKGNMVYKEDFWDVEIRPITFKYVYLTSLDELRFTNSKESRIRDKYMKIRVKYSGNDLAIIQGIKTIFTISYA